MSKLGKALRAAADSIESGVYDWDSFETCNVGHLVGALFKKTGDQVAEEYTKTAVRVEMMDKGASDGPPWTEVAKKAYKFWSFNSTALPKNDLCARMFTLGLTPKDITAIEYLSNKTVAKKAGIPACDEPKFKNDDTLLTMIDNFATQDARHRTFGLREHAIKYLRAYADFIEARMARASGDR